MRKHREFDQLKEKSMIRSVLKNEIAQVFMILGGLWFFVTLVILPLNNVTNEVEYLKTNHLAHMEQSISDLEKNQRDLDKENETAHREIMERLGKICGKLGIDD